MAELNRTRLAVTDFHVETNHTGSHNAMTMIEDSSMNRMWRCYQMIHFMRVRKDDEIAMEVVGYLCCLGGLCAVKSQHKGG